MFPFGHRPFPLPTPAVYLQSCPASFLPGFPKDGAQRSFAEELVAHPKSNYTPGPAPAVPRIRLKHRSKYCIYTTRSYMRIKKTKNRKGAGGQEGPQRWLAARPRMFACNTGVKGRAALKRGQGTGREEEGAKRWAHLQERLHLFSRYALHAFQVLHLAGRQRWEAKGPRGCCASPLPLHPPTPFQGRPPWPLPG